MTTDTTPIRRRLTRSSSDKLLGGVAGGLGAHFSVDPVLFRIGFGVTTLAFGGAGALAYLALFVLMPTDRGEPAILGSRPTAA